MVRCLWRIPTAHGNGAVGVGDPGPRPYPQDTPTVANYLCAVAIRFAEKVADVVGLYLAPPAAAVVLSIDEKTQVQALDRTQPLLPIDFGATEKRTHDYMRHGTTNLFAALQVGPAKSRRMHPTGDGAQFLAFLKAAVKPHASKEIHVILDNLSTTPPRGGAVAPDHPHVSFHFTPVGSTWMNQIETWFGIITHQCIRRGTFTSVKALIAHIRDYIEHWNTDAQPFTWTATADEILAKVALTQTNIRQLVETTRSKKNRITRLAAKGSNVRWLECRQSTTGRPGRRLATVAGGKAPYARGSADSTAGCPISASRLRRKVTKIARDLG